MFHRPIITHRYFFAVRPPMAQARRIALAAPWLKMDSMVAEQRLHVTMFILDDLARPMPALERILRAIGDRVEAAPAWVRLDRIVGAGGSVAL